MYTDSHQPVIKIANNNGVSGLDELLYDLIISMKREKVKSTAMRSVGYNADLQVLEVEFPDKDVYRYSNLPLEVYVAFRQSPSLGTFLNRFIKDQYPEKKISN